MVIKIINKHEGEEIITWGCEKCNQVYNIEAEARNCECYGNQSVEVDV